MFDLGVVLLYNIDRIVWWLTVYLLIYSTCISTDAYLLFAPVKYFSKECCK